MDVVSTRDFERFCIGGKIVPVIEGNNQIRKKAFFARVNEARRSIAEGKGTSVSNKEELDSLLANL